MIPPSLRPAAKGFVASWLPATFKYTEGGEFWEAEWKQEGCHFENQYYRRTMLGLANEPDSSFLTGKIVADFGCGPRGSLCWATEAKARIGIDVMIEQFVKFGISSHDMVYIRSTEREIPLASNYVDVLYTLNAIDHVSRFSDMCREMLRVLKPGGLFAGSFNLEEPPTFNEPQTLSERRVRDELLVHLEVESYRVAAKGPEGDAYGHFFDDSQPPTSGERFLWVRARKRS